MAVLFDSRYKGKIAVTKGTGNVNIRATASTSAGVIYSLKQGDKSAILTGNYNSLGTGNTWWEILLPIGYKGWVRYDVFNVIDAGSGTTGTSVSPDETQKILNNLVESDKAVYESLIRVGAMTATGKIKVSDPMLFVRYSTLVNRLNARQQWISEQKSLSIQKGKNNIYAPQLNQANQVLVKGSIGAIPLVAIIIIVAVISIGATVGIYQLLKPKYDESTADLKMSKDLENVLATLSPAAAEKVKKDLEKQIDDAYNQGQTDGSFAGIGGTIKYLAVAVGGFFLIKLFMDKAK